MYAVKLKGSLFVFTAFENDERFEGFSFIAAEAFPPNR